MYPEKQKNPTEEERLTSLRNNPEEAASRGLWGDNDFLEKVAELNPKLKQTQFADYHGHGWVFRAVFKKDKKGNLQDLQDNVIAHDDPKKFAKADSSEGHPSRQGNAVRGLPLRHGRSWQR